MRALAATSLLLLTALLSGCAGSEPGEPVSADAADPAPAAAGDGSPAAVAGGDDAAAAPAVREEPIQASGTSPLGACAGVSGVFGNCFNQMGDGNFKELPEGTLRLRGTLTWTPDSPATETMGVLLLVPCGQDCWTSTGDTPAVYGTSPLEVDLDASGLDEDVALWVSGYQGTGTVVGWAGAQVPQQFAFEGTVVRAA